MHLLRAYDINLSTVPIGKTNGAHRVHHIAVHRQNPINKTDKESVLERPIRVEEVQAGSHVNWQRNLGRYCPGREGFGCPPAPPDTLVLS